MNLQEIVAHILGFCLLVADYPTSLFKTQTSTPISHHLNDLDASNQQDYFSTTFSSTHVEPTCTAQTLNPVIDPSMNNCNNAQNRQQWCYGLNITTDYEDPNNFPITNVTRKYTLVITSSDTYNYCGDGYATRAMLINGSYPGPLIEGNWGDWFEITVINNLSNCNGTSIHWHGLRQWNTVFEDGVAGVTQCPIPPALTDPKLIAQAPSNYSNQMTYKWQATQYGASWYHSHFSLQYADGIAGPLVIHGPTSANYDHDLGPLMISDWYHEDAFSMFWLEQTTLNNITLNLTPPSKLINGLGQFKTSNADGTQTLPGCSSKPGSRCVLEKGGLYKISNITKGETYRLRVINTSANSHYTFWIDGHDFTVIATDFVPVQPWTTNVLNVAIGQRYDIIFTANADTSKGDRFWIKMRHCSSYCITEDQPPCPHGLGNCTYEECRQGIISYSPNNGIPDSNSGPEPGDQHCMDIDRTKIYPIVHRNVTGIPRNFSLIAAYKASNNNDTNNTAISRWSLWDDGTSFVINWGDPALILLENQEPQPTGLPNGYVPVEIDNGGKNDVWHAFVIEANWTSDQIHKGYKPGDPETSLRAFPLVAHPIHLHGHDFVVLLQSTEMFNPNKTYDLTTYNPIRRDVAMLPANGFVMLAFRVDNPGPWLMHCHIAWHASNGLALQFVENKGDIPKLLANSPHHHNILQDMQTQCENWDWWYNKVQCKYDGQLVRQDDSGI